MLELLEALHGVYVFWLFVFSKQYRDEKIERFKVATRRKKAGLIFDAAYLSLIGLAAPFIIIYISVYYLYPALN